MGKLVKIPAIDLFNVLPGPQWPVLTAQGRGTAPHLYQRTGAAAVSGCLMGHLRVHTRLRNGTTGRDFGIFRVQLGEARNHDLVHPSTNSTPATYPRGNPSLPGPYRHKTAQQRKPLPAAQRRTISIAHLRQIRCNNRRTCPPQPCSFNGQATLPICHTSRFVTKQWQPRIDGALFSPRPWPGLRPV
jgi:hypothetical protein